MEMNNLAQLKGKVVLYARTASSHPNDAACIGLQMGKLRDFAKQQGFEDYVEYWDDGYSGHNANRPRFIEINREIEDGAVGIVIVKCIDRIFRNCILAYEWQRRVESMGVTVLAMDGSHEPPSIENIFKGLLKQPQTAV